jgi:hypothetical protein
MGTGLVDSSSVSMEHSQHCTEHDLDSLRHYGTIGAYASELN